MFLRDWLISYWNYCCFITLKPYKYQINKVLMVHCPFPGRYPVTKGKVKKTEDLRQCDQSGTGITH